MPAILQFHGPKPAEKPVDAKMQPHDITDDQIDYAHELAEECRRAWASAKTKN